MFTEAAIEQANSGVKTGADFPSLARELAEMGVAFNDVYVADGHAEYIARDGGTIRTPGATPRLEICETSDFELFATRLKLHQRGETDYPQFRSDCAAVGVEKWRLDFTAMTCTYFDRDGETMLVESIPGI